LTNFVHRADRDPEIHGDYDPAAVSRFLFGPDALPPAELAIVFGMTRWRGPLERAIQLYSAGLAPKLLFTGGYNARLGANEAVEMAKAAADHGVPQSDIILEPSSTNTAENVTNAFRAIEQTIGIHNVDTILLVAIHFHIRRAKLTAERVFPSRVRFGIASHPSAFYSDKNWYLSERGRADVYAEVAKIETYLGEDLSALKSKRRVSHDAFVYRQRGRTRPPPAADEFGEGAGAFGQNLT
jgi:uncharacterized SAM-binding protein YcdF (DUF218 family)